MCGVFYYVELVEVWCKVCIDVDEFGVVCLCELGCKVEVVYGVFVVV